MDYPSEYRNKIAKLIEPMETQKAICEQIADEMRSEARRLDSLGKFQNSQPSDALAPGVSDTDRHAIDLWYGVREFEQLAEQIGKEIERMKHLAFPEHYRDNSES